MLLDQTQLAQQNIQITGEGESDNQQFMIVNEAGGGGLQQIVPDPGSEQGYTVVNVSQAAEQGGEGVMVMLPEGQGTVMAQMGPDGQMVTLANGESGQVVVPTTTQTATTGVAEASCTWSAAAGSTQSTGRTGSRRRRGRTRDSLPPRPWNGRGLMLTVSKRRRLGLVRV